MTIVHTYDDVSDEVIRATDWLPAMEDFPETVIVTYSRHKFDDLQARYPCTEIATLNTACAAIPIYRVEYEGTAYATYLSLIGGAAAAAIMEEVIALGGRRFLFCGSCGVLDSSILEGHIAVPTAAFRDEGTSYHYLPAAPYIDVLTANRVTAILRDLGVPFHETRTWTTDAIYRETRGNMAKRMAEGCLVVEMECASTAAVAQFRNVEFAQFLYGADSLDGTEWDPRSLVEAHHDGNAAIVDLAFRIAERLT